jgi:hypothetical protein
MLRVSEFFGILEWAALRRNELMSDWERAREGSALARISPLE